LDQQPLTGGMYCGPATVLEAGPSALKLLLPGQEARAELALAYPYQPQVNDLVLALGSPDGDMYVVGVLQGKGRTRLCVEGDLELEARGRLELRGHAGVRIEGEHVSVSAGRYELSARSVIERLGNVYRWATGVITTYATRTRTVVEESATLAAGRIVEKAKADVTIDGERIRLG
jgi:Protein of unknown function (DUF3540).